MLVEFDSWVFITHSCGFRKARALTWPSSNWSPPNADTQGFIPPVPKAIRARPIMDRALGKEGCYCRNARPWKAGASCPLSPSEEGLNLREKIIYRNAVFTAEWSWNSRAFKFIPLSNNILSRKGKAMLEYWTKIYVWLSYVALPFSVKEWVNEMGKHCFWYNHNTLIIVIKRHWKTWFNCKPDYQIM